MGFFSQLFGAGGGTSLPDNAVVVDVRSPSEFASGHIQGAINIPLDRFSGTIASAVPDKHQPVVLCCLSGGRSGSALSVMKQLGYTQVHNGGGVGSLAMKMSTQLVRK
jgi:phage shock protein E